MAAEEPKQPKVAKPTVFCIFGAYVFLIDRLCAPFPFCPHKASNLDLCKSVEELGKGIRIGCRAAPLGRRRCNILYVGQAVITLKITSRGDVLTERPCWSLFPRLPGGEMKIT